MIQQLKGKGYTYDAKNDYLTGEFNGSEVNIRIATNNNKVWRIMVTDANPTRSVTNIKIRYNKLCRQFSNNGKYVPADLVDYAISEDEDISYEMTVHDKRYEAVYYQYSETDIDSANMRKWMMEKYGNMYSQEELEKLSETEQQQLLVAVAMDYLKEVISKKSVWFMIHQFYGEYYITMFYDNEYNHSDGEDL